jgi:multidrug efflux pump subunit AcrB
MTIGISGRIARAFLQSKLTPLLMVAALAAGLGALATTPREEEPQISVPMVDVLVGDPGATAAELERQRIEPLERRLWEIPGVEHLYSTVTPDAGMITVRFKVGDDPEISVVKVFAKLSGLSVLVKLHTIDEVPVLTLTLHGGGYEPFELRRIGAELRTEIQRIENVAQVEVIGGAPRMVSIRPDPAGLAAHGLSADRLGPALAAANLVMPAGAVVTGNRSIPVRSGHFLRTSDDVSQVLVGLTGGRAIRVGDVATVTDGPGEPAWYVSHLEPGRPTEPAVTLSIAKRPGVNAATLAATILERVEAARGTIVPHDLRITTTRNYGETATDKAAELLSHIVIATVAVALLVWLALGWREALVVLVAVPVTLALTLLVYRLLGYTLNRITLFALVFAIGILVDDAIVVVENISRHLGFRHGEQEAAAVDGVDEVGNPTILATFTVIAAILPMAFVTGLMGPYMRPIPVGASLAMLFSLGVAFVVTPYLALRLIRKGGHGAEPPPGATSRRYRAVLHRLLDRPRERWLGYGLVVVLLLASVSLVAVKAVTVKMLPFDNKSEFQVILDFPAGTTLETSSRAAQEIAERLLHDPDVRDIQVYAGVAAPFNFNGLVRHYFLRRGPDVADLQVNLAPADRRAAQSHAIAVRLRPVVAGVAARYRARAKVAEIPPGPPVLATLTAEVFGPDSGSRRRAATLVRSAFDHTAGIVDVDWTLPDSADELQVMVRPDIAGAAGLSSAQVAEAIRSVGGVAAGLLHDDRATEPVPIVVQVAEADRAGISAVRGMPVTNATGAVVPVGVVAGVESRPREAPRFRKDLKPVIYVTGDVAGALEAPVYAMLAVDPELAAGGLATTWSGPAARTETPSVNWDGEWRITYEVFRDLGMAFAVVLVLIYFLVVAWFQSFVKPLVIMAPIPLTLIGILPGHAIGRAFFTATSMIGMIALAGIIVRNSILLVDFAELAQRQGRSVRDAVIEAGVIRARPIGLTAAAVAIGGAVMVTDPIFQGLGIALMAGALVATLFTLILIPLLYAEVVRGDPPSTRKDD